MLLAFGPRGVHAIQRAPQRRRVHVAPRGDAQHDVAPAADAQVHHRGQRNLRVPAGSHVRQQIQAGLPRVAAALHKARRPRAQRRPPGTGWGRGKGALASPLRLQRTTSTPTYSASLRHASKTRRQLGAPGVLHDAGATRLSKLVGCALSLSVFSLWQSPQRLQNLHAARKGCLTGTRGPARRRPSARSRTAR